ncbi:MULTISPECIES: hypothetical protein [unclassified Paenibacillus]|nr:MULTISPECIES: hypothetical protein [unclassified Paenibacillus]MBP1172569.1 methyl-accepting chemotaxis protein [Paenibacillus sp. PvR098]MBP2438949.1 methyl-accepting chemotaxis protein [Paenibacillus sp. PvP052]
MGRISNADLSEEYYDGKIGTDEIGRLLSGAVEMSRQLRTLIQQIQLTAELVTAFSGKLSSISRRYPIPRRPYTN